MKILKHGNPEYIHCNDYKVECPNCGCVFTCDCGDFTKHEKGLHGHAWVRCPDCNMEIEIVPVDCLITEDEEDAK